MNPTQTDTLIYKILKQSSRLDISGDVYTAGERPEDSTAEDIVISNINFEHSTPQRGVSNVNIHVQDVEVIINGQPQTKANRERLQNIASVVESIIASTIVEGVKINLDTSQVFGENGEHYFNLRYSWVIAKPFTTDLDIGDDTLGEMQKEIEALQKEDEKIKAAITEIERKAEETDSALSDLKEKQSGDRADIDKAQEDIKANAQGIADVVAENEEQDNVLNAHARIIYEATGNIKTLQGTTATLNGDEQTEGSVRNIVTDYISKTQHLRQKIVDTLPPIAEVEENIMYLIPFEGKEGVYKQFAFIEGTFVSLDNTEVDLSDYYTKGEVDSKTKANADAIKAQDERLTKAEGDIVTNAGDIATLSVAIVKNSDDITDLQNNKMDKSAVWYGSLAEYNAMTSHDVNVRYYIEEV